MVEDQHPSMGARRASIDPDLVDLHGLAEGDIAQAFDVMEALADWQSAARTLAELSARYMHLNETDMRAIRMIMRAQQRGEIVTPKDIAHGVGISSASTTKLIDRLVDGGHLVRTAHPSDRRTTRIRVTASTRRVARETVGRQHARRFAAAAALSGGERAAVIRFLKSLTEADAPQGHLLDPPEGSGR
ncbi:MarR family winged helix-turn-helix transcriptional regulator [Microbacterium karelineae]|uniref:MarR family winged helix-turn-helix transcriptional regulator n=1 Tax=Microbacterium karelineae TaxID=2654283 RepID=UPI001E60F196|nr:MarR family transcriptional regulator [Microbacterium karelineae]